MCLYGSPWSRGWLSRRSQSGSLLYRVSMGVSVEVSIEEGLRDRMKASPEEPPGDSPLVRKSFFWLESIRRRQTM